MTTPIRISVTLHAGRPALVLRSEDREEVVAFNTREEAREIARRLWALAQEDGR